MQTEGPGDRVATERIRHAVEQLVEKGSATNTDGVERSIFPMALNPREAAALRDWVSRERAVHTVEVGLAFGFSTLHICQALVLNGDAEAKHVVIDPDQLIGYAGFAEF